MKTTKILIILVGLLVAGTTLAGIKLDKGVEIAQVGIGSDSISVFRVVDGDATCYITKQGKWGAHAISCVK